MKEMSAQVEEVTPSAQALAGMARRLQTLVQQFKLSEVVATAASAQPLPAASAVRKGLAAGRRSADSRSIGQH